MKKLIEKRNALMEEAEQLLTKCETETRALNEEEAARYDALSAEIAAIGKTIEANGNGGGA